VALAAALAVYRSRSEDLGSPRERWLRATGQDAARGPNIVLVTIDTLRADRLGSYGSSRGLTPNLDALAAEAVRFRSAASTVPFTLPAHSSLMTGTYPPFHGVRENVGYTLDDRLPTLAGSLAAGGWATGGFVSAFVLDSRWGIARGFDTYFDDFDSEESRGGNLAAVQRPGAETIAAALGWLDERPAGPEAKPVFLWLHLFEPHDPYTPPEPYLSRHPGRPYDGEVAWADELFGRFRDGLEERGLLDRSLVVVTGDHGEGLGQHGEGFHGFFIYDSTVHVPLLVRSPGGVGAGEVVEAPVSHVDVLPTLLDLAGRPLPESAQGRSLAPFLLGEEAGETETGAVYTESMYPLLHYGWAPLRSLRAGSYKLIDAPRPELYDLAADPEETTDIIRRERAVARELKERLDALTARIESGAEEPGRPADIDEETLAQLEALGYLAGRGGVSLADEKAVERADPKDRIDLHQRVMAAQSALGRGEIDRAREHLEAALAADATMVDAHQMLGRIAAQEERFEAAAGHFRDALAVRDDHVESLYGLATAYLRLGREDEALVGFERLLALDASDVKAVTATAGILNRRGRPAEAIAVLERALARESPPPVLLNQLGELKSLAGEARAAIALFERAVAAGAEQVAPRFNLAVLYEEAGRRGEAVALYEQVVERAPKHFQAQFNLGRLYGARGDAARQQAMWEAALGSNPDFARGYFFLAKLLMDRGGDLARAERLAREGLERDPEHRAGPLGYYVLADILNRTGRGREAMQAAEAGRRIQAGG